MAMQFILGVDLMAFKRKLYTEHEICQQTLAKTRVRLIWTVLLLPPQSFQLLFLAQIPIVCSDLKPLLQGRWSYFSAQNLLRVSRLNLKIAFKFSRYLLLLLPALPLDSLGSSVQPLWPSQHATHKTNKRKTAKISHTKTTLKSVLCWHSACSRVVDILSVTPLKKTDFSLSQFLG